MAKSKTNQTNTEVKEVKAMEKKEVWVNEKAYEGVSKKGTPIIILEDKDGNVHYIELAKRTKYHQYTGKAYTSNEHNAYTITTVEVPVKETKAKTTKKTTKKTK